jgi:hypothetical protein
MALRGKQVENAAIAWVLERERAAGREPVDARTRRGFPGDIDSPPRIIEVKAFGRSARSDGFLWLEVTQVEEARRNPDFYVYVVENVGTGDPADFTLKVLGRNQLARLLERAREKRYFELPLPVAEYDSAPEEIED